MLNHYVATALAAATQLNTRRDQPRSHEFTGREQALEWLETERTNLTAAATLTARRHRRRRPLPGDR